ncbi:MAG: sugar phosphate isomerase/epimerase [Clostridiaceae bacterium]|nr:sugar phosphate isomerase/epimerase [Clostridiaceae bacterium]
MPRIGIYYAFWEDRWQTDYSRYIRKAAQLGLDILEIACTPVPAMSRTEMARLRDEAADLGVMLTAGHGPSAAQNLASSDPAVQRQAIAYYTDLLERLAFMNIRSIGGGIYSYWPVDYTRPIDKPGDWARSVQNVRAVGAIARDLGIAYCLESLNRFEGYLINTASEAVQFVQEVGLVNVKVMLDTFHMNIEEDSFAGAIQEAGSRLGHFHIGETNRKPPGQGRMPWAEIASALKGIDYQGPIVMEPFVKMGGQVGQDIRVWRDLSQGASESELDAAIFKSVAFCRQIFA